MVKDHDVSTIEDLSVRATVEAGQEDEFIRSYNSEHIPDVVNIFPGCLAASRCKVKDGDGSHQYMALHAFRTAEELKAAIGSAEIEELIRKPDEARVIADLLVVEARREYQGSTFKFGPASMLIEALKYQASILMDIGRPRDAQAAQDEAKRLASQWSLPQ